MLIKFKDNQIKKNKEWVVSTETYSCTWFFSFMKNIPIIAAITAMLAMLAIDIQLATDEPPSGNARELNITLTS